MRAAATDAAYALAAIGLNVHFGYTGLPNFGQVASSPVGAYGMAMGVDTFGWSMWLAFVPRASSAAVLLACCSRDPDPPTASRLPRHRHHRAARSCGSSCEAPRGRDRAGGFDGLQAFADRSTTSTRSRGR